MSNTTNVKPFDRILNNIKQGVADNKCFTKIANDAVECLVNSGFERAYCCKLLEAAKSGSDIEVIEVLEYVIDLVENDSGIRD